MQKRKRENDRYLYVGIFLSALLVVGLLSLMTGIEKKERKIAKPDGRVEEKKEKKKEEKEYDIIRVVLKTNGFKDVIHKEVSISSKSGLVLRFGEGKKECNPEETILIKADDSMLRQGVLHVKSKKEGDKIRISSLKRGYGVPEYRGKLELYAVKEGIVLVNELPLEEYLYAVVPSEMPASYGLEALKAQAVCARSYAVKQMKNYGYPDYNAHVDDSVSYQVYGNSKEQESTIQAVKETMGQKVWYDGKVATTYYFSTSCGKTTSAEAWGSKPSKANAYLQSVELKGKEGDYEKNFPWYQWKANVSEKVLGKLLSKNVNKKIGKLKDLQITKKGSGGVVLEIKAVGEHGEAIVKTENKIRRALGGKGYTIVRKDGKKVKSSELLPSAFFDIKKEKDCYIIEGGGYGHGIGMSQNCANEMAKAGKDYKEILQTFYQGIEVKE